MTKIILTNEKNEFLNGIVQIGSLTAETIKGKAEINAPIGKHLLRATVFGYKGKIKNIEIKDLNEEVTVILERW